VAVLSPEQARNVSEKLEKTVLKMPERTVSVLSCMSIALSATFVFFGYSVGDGGFIQVKDLAFRHGLILPSVFIALAIMAFVCAAVKTVPDRFYFATLFIMIGFIVFWVVGLEVKSRFPGYDDVIDTKYAVFFLTSFLSQIGAILLCGIEASRSRPRFGFFKFTNSLGDWLQLKYDNSLKKQKNMTGPEARMSRAKGFIVMSLFFLAVGAAALGINRSNSYYANKSAAWPSVDGKIVSSKVEKARKGNRVELNVEYGYLVKGEAFKGSRIMWGLGWTNDRELIDKLSAYCVSGATVSVYYDPDDPARSVLFKGVCFNSNFDMAGIVITVALAISFFTYGSIRYYRAFKKSRVQPGGHV
jgi:hypothetical protein